MEATGSDADEFLRAENEDLVFLLSVDFAAVDCDVLVLLGFERLRAARVDECLARTMFILFILSLWSAAEGRSDVEGAMFDYNVTNGIFEDAKGAEVSDSVVNIK